MTKRVIFCADGTWNGPDKNTGSSVTEGQDDRGEVSDTALTNVLKIFANLAGQVTAETLALHKEQEKVSTDAAGNVTQVAKYIHGVGDSANPLVKFLGGVFGVGVISRVVRGYTFISRSYSPGDEIHLVGFSRGAYTARALGGMIAKVGLLNPRTYDPTDKEEAYRFGIAAWAKSKSLSLEGANKLTDVANHLLRFIETFVASELPTNGLIRDVPLKSVAVWDTVGSLGIPEYAGDKRMDVFRFVDTKLSDRVERGFHAMAIDEMRRDFPVTRWEPRDRIEQVWFVGAHADVGGGYPASESRLSDTALGWMMKKLSGLGVAFATPLVSPLDPQTVGPPVHTPWNQFPFAGLPLAARRVEPNDVLHASVVRRWNADLPPPPYRPEAMSDLGPQGIGGRKVDDSTFP